LTIEFEASPPILDVQPEFVEASGEVAPLGIEDGKALAIALVVRGSGAGAPGFLLGVEAPEREDGEAVDHHAGCFGVQWRGLILRRNAGEEQQVDVLGQVIAALVEPVDGVFVFGDVVVGGERIPGGVLVVPEVEVGAVLVEDQSFKAIVWYFPGERRVVPAVVGLVVQADDVCGVEHRGRF